MKPSSTHAGDEGKATEDKTLAWGNLEMAQGKQAAEYNQQERESSSMQVIRYSRCFPTISPS